MAATAKKEFNRDFSSDSFKTLIVNSKNSSFYVRTWSERIIRIEAVIEVSARSHADAQKMLDLILVNKDESGSDLKLNVKQPELKTPYKEKTFAEKLFGSSDTVIKIKFKIMMPMDFDIELNSSKGEIDIENMNGNIKVNTSEERINLRNISGSLIAYTTNAEINAKLLSLNGEKNELSTTKSDITLEMSEETRATLRSHANNGTIRNDFDIIRNGPFSEYKQYGWINGGGAVINIYNLNGNINIRKF
ncbi:hypothetical protein ACFL7D_06985 [candidate division KSB1 bacterium]